MQGGGWPFSVGGKEATFLSSNCQYICTKQGQSSSAMPKFASASSITFAYNGLLIFDAMYVKAADSLVVIHL